MFAVKPGRRWTARSMAAKRRWPTGSAGGDRGGGDGVQPGQVGDAELPRRQDRRDRVAFDPSLDRPCQRSRSRAWHRREQRDRGDEPLPMEVVARA